MTPAEIEEPFSQEEKGAGTVRCGSTHSSLVMEHDLERMDSIEPLMSKAGICRSNPASTGKEEQLAMALYREAGLTVPEIQRRGHEVGYVDASQEEVKSSVSNISNCQATFVVYRREE